MRNIPEDINKKTKKSQEDAKKKLDEFSKAALQNPFIPKLKEFTGMAIKYIEQGHQTATNAIKAVKPFDDTRWKIGLAISLLVFVVMFGVIFGSIAGALGTYCPLAPRQPLRTVSSYVLITVVYWILLVSSILMLLTTFLFIIGGIIEVYACRPLFDEKYTLFDKVAQIIRDETKVIPQGDEYKLARTIVPSFVLSSCENNKTAYVALNISTLDLKSLLDYKKFIDLEKHLKDFSSIRPPSVSLPSATTKEFTDLKDALNFNFPEEIFSKLDRGIPNFLHQRNLLSSLPGSEDAVRDLDQIEEGIQKIISERRVLKENLEKLEKSAGETKDVLDKLIDGIAYINRDSVKVMEGVLKEIVDSISKSISGHCDQLLDGIVKSLETDIAHCKPAWNVFNSARIVLCKYYILPLNGLWFGTGWSLFFFVPLICICTKLSDGFTDGREVIGSEDDYQE